MAVRDADGSRPEQLNVQVRVTSEESLLVECPQPNSKTDSVDAEADNPTSPRSTSEADNSVFTEMADEAASVRETPAGAEAEGEEDSGDDSDEVDDIELIFTTDESKDMSNLQEDLVSIRESEPWAPSPTKTTPVLTKFHTLDPDVRPHDTENGANTTLASVERVRLPGESKSLEQPDRRGILKSLDNKSDYALSGAGKSLQSTDSLSRDYRGLSFETTKSSSFELGSGADMPREDSCDSLAPRRRLPRYLVVAETDISRCGVSEEDLADVSLARRNTCPNAFQYRPSPHRSYQRQPGPLKPGSAGRVRPILRTDSGAVRRESGAQTEVSALPPRWSSEGYLARKFGAPPLATLPQRAPPAPPDRERTQRRAAVETRRATLAPHAAMRTDEARRALLSDIGFTSMVPELSRSADPVWAEGGGACGACGAVGGAQALRAVGELSGRAGGYTAGGMYNSRLQSVDRSYRFTSSYIPAASAIESKEYRSAWRSSMPDVRAGGQPDSGDTDELLRDTEAFIRRSIDNLRRDDSSFGGTAGDPSAGSPASLARPYIPAEPRHLRLGHSVKLIAPHGRVSVGVVRYVGIAGATSADARVVVGAAVPAREAPSADNDGTHAGRRYFRTLPGQAAVFVPFNKVVMAWAN